METKVNIKHLAVIMDGNARWAKDNNLPKAEGHRSGAKAAKNLLSSAMELGVPYLTLYAFSSENWQRPDKEISVLLDLLAYYLTHETENLHKNGVKLKVIGNITRLSKALQQNINNALELTKNNDKMTLCIAFSYGGRVEIVDTCQKLINSGITKVTENDFKSLLYDPEMPDVDLLIRTSGVFRISNFLLWQIAYAELFFSTKNWPDFDKNDLIEALNDYSKRKRNFGTR